MQDSTTTVGMETGEPTRRHMYTPAEAAPWLKTTAAGVLAMIRRNEIVAVRRVVRGKNKRPRKFIQHSEIVRYWDRMPTDDPDPKKEAKRMKAMPSNLRSELEKATTYYR